MVIDHYLCSTLSRYHLLLLYYKKGRHYCRP
nr:MAG TPA: hypothetical protein [Caudoviricetes sp.]